ncbi:DUF6297 family protein [Aeromicrobium sp. Root472D3]|uniref:DUF6297 family protein n=2 Tax=Aeromicrobium TaxID=2040 RepID=UPI0006FE7A96|nr:DUF6297 family protein [Aeromicrobium sp. Root472D3]KQX76012.1 hypothetical protein ASD10_13015 [Aeromicrobium sp. Root472D3]
MTTVEATGARSLRRQMRAWRRDRADTTLYEQASEAYVWVFTIVLGGAMAISAMVQTRVSIASACTTSTCDDARTSLVWATVAGMVATTLAAAQAIGPVMVTPATGAWLLTTPVDRGPLLRRRLVAAAAAAAVACAAVVAVTGLLAGLGYIEIGVLSAGTALVGAGVTACAAIWQARDGRPTRIAALLLATATAVWMLLVALDVEPSTTTGWLGRPAGWVAAGVAGAAAVALIVRAAARVPRLLRAQLVPGGSLLASLSGALAGLDLSLAYDVLVARRWRDRATVRPSRGGPEGLWALVWRDVVRLRRAPGALAALVAALLVPYVVLRLDLDDTTVLASALAAFLCGLWSFSALRTTGRNPGLVRCFPMSLAEVRSATLVVPGGLLLVWSLAAAPAIGRSLDDPTVADTLFVSVATGATALAAIARWMLAPPPDYSMPLIASPTGAIPTGLIGSALRGFDIVFLGVVPMLVAPNSTGALVSLALTGSVVSYLVARRSPR